MTMYQTQKQTNHFSYQNLLSNSLNERTGKILSIDALFSKQQYMFQKMCPINITAVILAIIYMKVKTNAVIPGHIDLACTL